MKLFSETANANPEDSKNENENKYDQKVPADEVEDFEKDMIEKIYAKADEFGISKEELDNMNCDYNELNEEIKKKGEEIENDKLAEFGYGEFSCIGLENIKEEIELNDSKKNIKEMAKKFKLSEEDFTEIIKTIEKSDFEKNIEEKAGELEISKDVFYKLAGFDLNNCEANLKDLKDPNSELSKNPLSRREFEEDKDQFYSCLDEIQKDKETGDLKEKKLSKLEKFMGYIRKHKKPLALGELSLYASTLGAPALNFLVDEDVKVKIGDKEVSLEDLTDDPELIKKDKNINVAYADLCSLQETYDAPSHENFEYDSYILSIDSEIYTGGSGELVHISFEPDDDMKIKVSDKMLREIDNISQVEFRGSPGMSITEMTVDEFLENKEKVIDIISENINAPRDEVKNYVENVYIPDISNVSIVDFGDFKINKELPENSKFENLKNMEATYYDYEDMDKFEDLFLEILEKEYTIEELKEIAQDDPEKVILIMSEVINKNLEYDEEEWEETKNGNWEDIRTPYEALSRGKAICYAYSSIFISAKHVLEEKGIPHFDKFVAFGDGANGHAWNRVVTAHQDDLDVSCVDLDEADKNSGLLSKIFDSKLTKEKLNADSEKFNSKYNEINKEETEYKEKIEHKTTFFEKIKNYKSVFFQENLKKILTQYDPKLHKREQEIKIDEETLEKIAEAKKALNSLP